MKWVIAYIDNKHRDDIESSLESLGIKFKVCIPCIRILRKRFKNKPHFSYIPLLFNYGFIKLPKSVIRSKEKLIEIKDKVPGIYSWMYKQPIDGGYAVEVVTVRIVKRLNKKANDLSIFSANDLKRFKPGDYIVLKNYPFEGLEAQIKSFNSQSKKVKVNLFIMGSVREVEVDYENIFYSIYEDFDEKVSFNSVDEMMGRNNNSFDRIEFKNQKNARTT